MARPFGLLDRLVVRELAALHFATLGGTTVLYLVLDYADRAPMIGQHLYTLAGLQFYANKAAVIVYQLAPAALILAGAMFVARMTRAGELSALLALGTRPLRIAAPIAAFALAMAAAVFLLGEGVVVGADERMDEINLKGFGNWGDWLKYHPESTWLRGRGGSRFFKLGPARAGGFEPVIVLEVVKPFRLARRIDATRLEPAPGGKWRLVSAVETRYGADGSQNGGQIERRAVPELIESFPETPSELVFRTGRPRQMAWAQLREQTERRARAGQPVREWRLVQAERVGQAAVGIPGALAAFGISLGSLGERKKRPLATSIMIGLCMTFALWMVTTVMHAAALSGLLPPFFAGSVTLLLAGGAAAGSLAFLKA